MRNCQPLRCFIRSRGEPPRLPAYHCCHFQRLVNSPQDKVGLASFDIPYLNASELQKPFEEGLLYQHLANLRDQEAMFWGGAQREIASAEQSPGS